MADRSRSGDEIFGALKVVPAIPEETDGRRRSGAALTESSGGNTGFPGLVTGCL